MKRSVLLSLAFSLLISSLSVAASGGLPQDHVGRTPTISGTEESTPATVYARHFNQKDLDHHF
ncbi:MAG: hypothetical protein HY900_28045 [Deltaproteobacteria bacterium]|nr:hypothetical protein [Deltaproteobacteria bacterium]